VIDRARESTIQTSECVHHVTDASPFLFNNSRHQTLIKSCHTCQPSILYIYTSPFVSRGGASSFTRRRRSIGDARDDTSHENSRVVVVCRLSSSVCARHTRPGTPPRGASFVIGHSASSDIRRMVARVPRRDVTRRRTTTTTDDDGRRRTTTDDDVVRGAVGERRGRARVGRPTTTPRASSASASSRRASAVPFRPRS